MESWSGSDGWKAELGAVEWIWARRREQEFPGVLISHAEWGFDY